jgi:tRNA modification GTPase
MAAADILLWLGPPDDAPTGALLVAAKADLDAAERPGLPISVMTGAGMADLRAAILMRAKALLPRPGALALNARHREIISDVARALSEALEISDLLIRAEALRVARQRLDALTGRSGVESMLDALFGAFCIGK